jgi:transposase
MQKKFCLSCAPNRGSCSASTPEGIDHTSRPERTRWNTPIVRAYYLKESFQLFWEYRQPQRAQDYLRKWMSSAMRSRLQPFKKFVRMLRSHLDGILPWTKLRLSNGAVEGMNNKIKSISHRSFGFRSAQYFIAAIYHCCAKLPLPSEC